MLFPAEANFETFASVYAFVRWHPDEQEAQAASDYALDSTARSTGVHPVNSLDSTWWHREWLIRHIGPREFYRGYVA